MDHTIDELNTLSDFVRWGASRFNEAKLFFGHGTDNALDEAVVLVLHALHLPYNFPQSLWNTQLTYPEKRTVFNLLQRRIQERMPTPYLTQEAWFANLQFFVDQRVLIPRSPLGELIQHHFAPWIITEKTTRVLDLCTGSGCIAIATALVLPEAEVDAVDISSDALAVAQQNVENYGLEHRLHLVHSNLFENLVGSHYDLILSNPPYADAYEMEHMPPEYQHEPRLGLEAGEDGLLLVKQILREAPAHLTPHGVLIVEVGASQDTLVDLYPEVPFTWLEFEHGGEGVFLLTMEQLLEFADSFNN
jgi:ribosomal protein L3 glutamine methyltransferase